jgi:hypothetical protein
MKKILFILLLLITISTGPPQPKYSFTWLRAEVFTNTGYFIYHGDTIDFSSMDNIMDRVEIEEGWIKFYKNDTILDSALWNYSQVIDTFMIQGDSIMLSLSDMNSIAYLNISSLTSKLDTVTVDSTLTGRGTVLSPLGINSTILANTMKTVYTITLPSNSTVAGRCAGAVEGTDYPTGWTIEAGTNTADLKVTHGLQRRVAYVSVWSVDGVSERQLFGNAAYSGILAETNEILIIESLATVTSDIVIEIVFGE